MNLTYRYRLLPLKSQHPASERLIEAQRELYNAALEERIDCYRKTGNIVRAGIGAGALNVIGWR